MRFARRALFALLPMLFGCSTRLPLVEVSPEPTHYAWWLRTSFNPSGHSLRGIPVGQVNREWCRVNEVEPAMFARVVPSESEDWDPRKKTYSVDGFLVDGKLTTAALAAFKSCSGQTGIAVVLLSTGETPKPRAIATTLITSPAGWATLELVSPTQLRVLQCINCDSFTDFTWDHAARGLVPMERAEEEL